MLEAAKSCGIDKIIFTSHLKHNYANYQEQMKAYKKIKPLAIKLGIMPEFGVEVHWKKLAENDLKTIPKFTLGKSKFFLLEFSYPKVPDTWKNITNSIKKLGLKVIIAHPERYKSIHDNYKLIQEFKNNGCFLMLSGQSLNKESQTKQTWKTALRLLKDQYVDIIASDAHNVQDYKDFIDALNIAQKYNFNIQKAERLLQGAF